MRPAARAAPRPRRAPAAGSASLCPTFANPSSRPGRSVTCRTGLRFARGRPDRHRDEHLGDAQARGQPGEHASVGDRVRPRSGSARALRPGPSATRPRSRRGRPGCAPGHRAAAARPWPRPHRPGAPAPGSAAPSPGDSQERPGLAARRAAPPREKHAAGPSWRTGQRPGAARSVVTSSTTPRYAPDGRRRNSGVCRRSSRVPPHEGDREHGDAERDQQRDVEQGVEEGQQDHQATAHTDR